METIKYVAEPMTQFKLLYVRASKKCLRKKQMSIMRYFIQIFFALMALALYFDVFLLYNVVGNRYTGRISKSSWINVFLCQLCNNGSNAAYHFIMYFNLQQ